MKNHFCSYYLIVIYVEQHVTLFFGMQAHFEDSQFETARQDGKRLLKWNAVPTLFDVPNKPKPVTVSRINPLTRKRTAGVLADDCCPASLTAADSLKVSRFSVDHMYCKSEPTVTRSSSGTGCDHTYAYNDGPYMFNGTFNFITPFSVLTWL